MRCFTLFCSFLLVTLSASANAATYTVRPDGSGDYPTIQAAITASTDGDTVLLVTGTYYGDGNRDISFEGKAITVESETGNSNECIIDCEGLYSDPHRGFRISNGEEAESILRGVSIINAYFDYGAAVTCWYNSSPTFENCTFKDNISSHHNEGAGAVWCQGSPTFRSCVFDNNRATRGGAVFCESPSEVIFEGCLFRGNTASAHGGAVYCHGVPTFSNCIFVDNYAEEYGGAIFGGPIDVSSCTFHGNMSDEVGGAIALGAEGESSIITSTLCYNEALEGGTLHFDDIHTVLITNTIIAHSTNGSAISCDDEPYLSILCSDIFGNEGGDWVGCISDQAGVGGNIELDPLLCNPEWEDWHLLEESPCAPFSDPNLLCNLTGAWPVGCGANEAVCCVDQACDILTNEECFNIGGEWLGAQVSCDPNPCVPTIHYINADGTGDYPTIQMAIDVSREGDTVELAEGTYTGIGNRDLEFHGKAITLRSASASSESCIIDCLGSSADPHRGIEFKVEGPGTIVENITIKNGYETTGGGVLCRLVASPTLIGCSFIENTAQATGGGIHSSGAAPTFMQCLFDQNTAIQGGGAFFEGNTECNLTSCEFTHNQAVSGKGGGVSAEGPVDIQDCLFEWNTAFQGGGGVYFAPNTRCLLTSCEFTHNQVGPGLGGAILAEGTIDIQSSLFNRNIAPQGGGIALSQSEASIGQCTLYANHASEGGGIWCDGGQLVAENSIIAWGTFGDAIHCVEGFNAVLECCDIYGNDGGDYVGCIDWLVGLYGNISEDPLLCDPEHGDFYLQTDSPCAAYTPPNTECDLIGAFASGCAFADVPTISADNLRPLSLMCAPNPFSSSVRLEYTIPGGTQKTQTRLSIFDITGRHLETLIDSHLLPGTHEMEWTAMDQAGKVLPAGVYFYLLKAGDTSLTKRVLLMR